MHGCYAGMYGRVCCGWRSVGEEVWKERMAVPWLRSRAVRVAFEERDTDVTGIVTSDEQRYKSGGHGRAEWHRRGVRDVEGVDSSVRSWFRDLQPFDTPPVESGWLYGKTM